MAMLAQTNAHISLLRHLGHNLSCFLSFYTERHSTPQRLPGAFPILLPLLQQPTKKVEQPGRERKKVPGSRPPKGLPSTLSFPPFILRLGLQPLQPPLPPTRFPLLLQQRIRQPIVQARLPSFPKLHSLRHQSEATPVLRLRDGLD